MLLVVWFDTNMCNRPKLRFIGRLHEDRWGVLPIVAQIGPKTLTQTSVRNVTHETVRYGIGCKKMDRISVVGVEKKSSSPWIFLPGIAKSMWRTVRFVVDPTYYKSPGIKGSQKLTQSRSKRMFTRSP